MPEPQPKQQPQIEFANPPEGVFSLYANNVAFGASPFDVRLMFGEMLEVTPDKIRVLQRAQIIMGWLQAKALAAFLQKHVDAFEELNGPLTMPTLPQNVGPVNPFEIKSK